MRPSPSHASNGSDPSGPLPTLLLLALGLFLPPQALAADPPSAEQILQQVDQNLYPAPYEQFLQIENQRPNGTRDKSVVYVARDTSGKSILVVVVPETILGRSIFRDDEKIWSREPGAMDPHEVGLSHTLLGGGFDYADLLPVNFSQTYTPTLKEVEDNEYILELSQNAPSQTTCANLTMRVNKKLLLPTETLCKSADDREIKRIRYKNIRQFGTFPPRPATLETSSALNTGYISRLTIGRMVPRDFDNTTFRKETLPNAGELLK